MAAFPDRELNSKEGPARSVVHPKEAGRPRALPISSLMFLLIAILGSSSAGYFYFKYQEVKKDAKLFGIESADGTKEEEAKKLVAQIGAIMLLPEGETPTVATVIDLDALAGQPFFVNAKVGDKVLVYSEAHKAILYRPSDGRIIEAMPFVLSEK